MIEARFQSKINCCRIALIGLMLLISPLVLSVDASPAESQKWHKIKSLIGPMDSLQVADPGGQTIVARNEHKSLIPASILKVLTSLGALHYLGPDFRYITEFYLDRKSNLVIKGYGDPLLISEIVNAVSRLLSALIGDTTVINNIVVDDAYFAQPLTIPGISSSTQPYDAPNGALCVNFNTVNFKRTRNGYTSAETQTPLLPFAEKKIKSYKGKSGRIVLSNVEKENTIYAGKLFRYFLKRNGVRIDGTVVSGQVNKSTDKLIYRYVSRFALPEVIAKLLEHSNNFTTNQLLISSGIRRFGAPGNLEKGVAALTEYAADKLQLKDMQIVEGSGISRRNRVTADQMMRILAEFEPNRMLMRHHGREYYKTGTLYGINTRAGYIKSSDGGVYRYAVMMNTRGKSTRSVMRRLLQELD